MKRPGGFDDSVAPEQQQPPAPKPERSTPPAATGTDSFGSFASGAADIAPVTPISVAPTEVVLPERGDGVERARARLKDAGRQRKTREKREQRRFTEHLRLRRRRWFVAIGSVLGLALFVVVGVFTPLMAVRTIDVQGANTVNAEELQHALSSLEGVPLALVSDQAVHRAVAPFPLIQRYAVERIPPHTLVVRIEERAPAIALERDGEFDLLDPAGVLLGRVPERPAGVPVGSPELTDTASPAFAAAAQIVRDMPEDLRQQLVAVRASNGQDVSFTLASGTEVLWGEAKETQRKSVVLRSMLAAVGSPTLIDVSAPEAPVFK